MNAPLAHLSGVSAEDERFMALALQLGRRALGNCWPNPAVGAVIVASSPDGPVIVGRGWTCPGGRPHAETEALRRAGAAASGATLYTTLEPCSHHGKTPPCVNAILSAGVARVVSAIEDPNPEVAGRGHATLRAAGVSVAIGPGAAEARRAHAGHLRRIRDGRPHVTLKLAVSADGKVAGAGNAPIAVTGEPARARVHRLRAMNDAILVGIGTALADDPALTCRLPGLAALSPWRIVLDGALRLPLDSTLVRTARDVPLIVVGCIESPAERERALRARGVEVYRVEGSQGRLDMGAALNLLAARGITRLMVEGGPTVAADFLTRDLVDEVVLVRAPKEIGPAGVPALAGLPLTALTEAPRFRMIGSEPVAGDIFDHYERA